MLKLPISYIAAHMVLKHLSSVKSIKIEEEKDDCHIKLF